MLHKRNMLMSSCMENNFRLICIKHTVKTNSVSYRTNLNCKIKCCTVFSNKLLLYFIRIILIYIENNKLLRLAFCDLTANFTTDRSTATCNENCFILISLSAR